jgi:hypothetical protein
MIPTDQISIKKTYATPQLETFPWLEVTGISLPIGTTGFPDNPLDEFQDTLAGKQ